MPVAVEEVYRSGRHSGFQVFCGQRLFPQDETAMENLSRYIIRSSFSQERMLYLAEPLKVVYQAKDGTEGKLFKAPGQTQDLGRKLP